MFSHLLGICAISCALLASGTRANPDPRSASHRVPAGNPGIPYQTRGASGATFRSAKNGNRHGGSGGPSGEPEIAVRADRNPGVPYGIPEEAVPNRGAKTEGKHETTTDGKLAQLMKRWLVEKKFMIPQMPGYWQRY